MNNCVSLTSICMHVFNCKWYIVARFDNLNKNGAPKYGIRIRTLE